MKILLVFILSFASAANAATQIEIIRAEKDVKKGVYINDAGVRVSKPDEYICNMYRATHVHYRDKTDWLLAVVKRGC